MSFFKAKSQSIPSETFAALDIGSSKVCCAIAKMNREITPEKGITVKILGVASHAAKGIRGASIINLDDLEDSILNGIHTAEQLAKQTIHNVYVNLPAESLQSHFISTKISLHGQAVRESHLQRALEVNRNQTVGPSRRIIHIFPIAYDVDDNTNVQDPKGMLGDTLTTRLHIVSAPAHLIANLSACLGRCHLDINAFVAGPYAAALSSLTTDEKEMGVTLLDIGSHSISISSFYNGNPVYLGCIPIGGNAITQDIAQGLNTTPSQAERLKTLYGSLFGAADDRETILVTQLGEDHSAFANPVSKSFLMHIIKARAEEIIETIEKTLSSQPIDPIVLQRFVITGGASQLQGFRDIMQSRFNKTVRIATPNGMQGIGDVIHTPAFSLCAGLLHYALRDHQGLQLSNALEKQKGTFKRLWNWIRNHV
ncbi:MAG: cell division protein FtsA [Pseudomonadota bacterium]|jgi:cell division protein FtsA|nr:cell division protein FtsA [Alphaproteobacteria bacterium]